jgi:predicted porin
LNFGSPHIVGDPKVLNVSKKGKGIMMKKISISALAFGVLAAANTAHAQSSVTLYGLIENSVTFGHNTVPGGNLYRLLGGNLTGTRWGLRGGEDLGGGTRAVFDLESGFNPNTGESDSGLEFSRQTIVGLKNPAWGTVVAGRQYVPDTNLVQGNTADAFFGAIFATPGDVDNFDNSIRVNNSVQYISPVFSGFQTALLYAFGQQAGSIGDSRAWGAALSYSTDAFSVAASYQYYNGGRATSARTFSNTTTDDIFFTPITAAYASAAAIKIARVAGQYTFGNFDVGLAVSDSQFTRDAQSTFANTQKFNSADAFLKYQFSPAFFSAIGYSYERSTGNSSAKYNQVSLGFDYALSKKTDVYVVGAWQKATGTQDPDGGQAQASIGSYGWLGSNGSAQEYVALGYRVKF